jgi:hypothetical protein
MKLLKNKERKDIFWMSFAPWLYKTTLYKSCGSISKNEINYWDSFHWDSKPFLSSEVHIKIWKKDMEVK